MDDEVRVVFAVNDLYIPPFGVALHSLIRHADRNRQYKIFVLNEGIGNGHWKKVKSMEQPNITIESVNVSEWMREHPIPTVNHLSKETTYRLLIPKIFPQYDKILYLDSDLLIRKDIAELFDIDLEGAVFGASIARLFRWSYEYITEDLSLRADKYFNCGVLLINNRLLGESNICEKGMRMLEEKRYPTQDQDVINILCQSPENVGKVKLIDGRWNVEWHHLYEEGAEVYIDAVRKGSLDLVKDPFIIHYTGPQKPWNHPELELAEYFWQEAKETVFYEEMLRLGIKQSIQEEQSATERLFERFIFPWKRVKPEEKVIIYGAGAIGHLFVHQLDVTKYAQVYAVCDKRYKEIKDINKTLIGPEDLRKLPDYPIVIALEKKKNADEVIKELEEKGIDRECLIWEKYVKEFN